ncbi:hypothetical protein [Pseudomonas sp. EMN2]|uniref:hypothetical protein n=1 Tax=Pseudomonas sp. EMN2 TaxID=2615212 RepID=UPI00129B0747|nr:hypothetical protein [Pseudomonas sp. EMN2]
MTTSTPDQAEQNPNNNGADQAGSLSVLHNPAIAIRFACFADAVQALRYRLAAKPGMALMLGQGEVALLVEGELKTSFYDEGIDLDAMEDFDLIPWARSDLDYTEVECIQSLECAMTNDEWVGFDPAAAENCPVLIGPTIMGVALPDEVHGLVLNMLNDLLQASTEAKVRERRGRLYGVMRTLERMRHPFKPGEVEMVEMYFDHETNNRLERIRGWSQV